MNNKFKQFIINKNQRIKLVENFQMSNLKIENGYVFDINLR